MCKKEEFNVVNHLNIQTCNAFPGHNDSLGAVTLSAAVYTWGAKLSCEKLRTTPCQCCREFISMNVFRIETKGFSFKTRG